MMPYNAALEAAVLKAACGAELLDRTAQEMPNLIPADWHQRIDLEAFDIGFMDRCVLGQVVPDLCFDDTCEALGLFTDDQIAEYGFVGRSTVESDALTRAWTNLILDRRAADKSTKSPTP